MKRLITIILIGVFAITMYAYEVTVDGIKYELNDDGTLTLKDATGFMGVLLEVPTTINGCTVTAIGDRAFMYCNEGVFGLLTIPESVTTIGNYAFYGCEGLNNVVAKGVKSIGERAFIYCGLGSIHIPRIEIIGDYAFTNTRITKLTLPESLNHLGKGAFSGCTKLTEVVIPNQLGSIPEGAFLSCSSLKKLTIGFSVDFIGLYAFSGTKLSEIKCLPPTPPFVHEIPNAEWFCFSGFTRKDCKLRVPQESVLKYETAAVWKDFNIVGVNGVDGVEADDEEKEVEGYYNLQGIRLGEPVRGEVNIVRYTDGTARKVVVE